MRRYFANILSGKTKLHTFHPLVFLLHIFSFAYLLIVQVRLFLYKTGIFKTNKLQCPVISVGNLTLGGTGKTPVVQYIARFFITNGLKPVILSRGYGRSSKTLVAIVSNGENILLKPEEAGDEPYLLAENNPTVPVIVGRSKFRAGETAIKKFNPGVIILDDGFQHLSLARDLNIVLLNCVKPPGNSYIFPAGSLREPVSALQRADMILYTHSDEVPDNCCENLPTRKDILKLKVIHTFDEIVCANDQKRISPEELNKKKIVLFCAIGEPNSFRKRVEQYGAEIVHYRYFPDHYVYKTGDLQSLHKTAENLKADFILTTQKDSVKIKEVASAFPLIWTVMMKIEFSKGEETFQKALFSCIKVLS
tara:strand:+ start:1382 stop:2473 length:1092 start_codon:yes stop_codon:yes gene_type:complete